MKVAITGSGGFIGQKLTRYLETKGFEVKPVSRLLIFGNQDQLSSCLAGTDVVINLAGAPILQRWCKKNKAIIYNSRIVSTWNITEAINMLDLTRRPKIFISASAMGIYAAGKEHDEFSRDFNDDFLGHVVKDWENASSGLDKNIRRVIFRMGMALGKDSQTIEMMIPLFKRGLGGQVGNGNQPFPFVHVDDLASAYFESIINENFKGIYNLVAPDRITNKIFTETLARQLKRPAFFKVPGIGLKILYGNAASLLLESPILIPRRLTEQGFRFQYPTISDTLKEITS